MGVTLRLGNSDKSGGPRSKGAAPREVVPFDYEDVLPGLDELVAGAGKGSKVDKIALIESEAFRETMGRLKEQVGGEADDLRSDVAMKVMLRAMLTATLEMVPTAHNKYLNEKNESAAYAYNALINQCKDIITAIRSVESLEEQADHIVNRILMPMFVSFTQNLVNGLCMAHAKINDTGLTVSEKNRLKDAMSDMVRSHINFVEESTKAVNLKTKEYLVGTDTKVVPPKRVGKRAT